MRTIHWSHDGLLLLALVPAAWAYINGGDFHDTRKAFLNNMEASGWAVSNGEQAKGEVNLLVGEALRVLPEREAGKISLEVKREIARLARDAIQEAKSWRKETIKTGQIGSVYYRVGAFRYETYWETNYPREGRRTYDRRTGLEPFVALKSSAPEDPKEADGLKRGAAKPGALTESSGAKP
jgi:hypothetical protein